VIRVAPFDDAVVAAADTLFSQVRLGAGEKRLLVIDPLIDGVSGMQSAATVLMGSRIAVLVRQKHQQFELVPLTVSAIEKAPIVLVGTFTVINQKNEVLKEREAYRICLALADMKTGKILSKGVARAQLAGVDHTPTKFFRDSPAWARDKLIQGYVRTCQATKPGDPIDAVYGERIAAAAITAEAIDLYQTNQYAKAATLFRQAAGTPSGNHLRNLNGWFAASMRVGNQKDASIATQRLVDYMLAERNLNFMFLFNPGSARFVTDSQLSAPYPIWIREIARGADAAKACLNVVGHTTRTGPEPANERLSLARAQTVAQQLGQQSKPLADRIVTVGMGSREPIVGSGTDDVQDAADRRVEFKVVDCPKT
jgi:outer membrane protein OmpA-like peptidoglycan-associated protein